MTKNKSFIKRTKSHNIWVFNTLLWGCSFTILLFLFSGNSSPSKIDYIYTATFIFTLIIPVSINIYWLLPTFLKNGKHLLFYTLIIGILILFAQLNAWLFNRIVNIFFSDYFFISYHNTVEIYFIFFVFFLVSILIKLAEEWSYLNRLEKETLRVEKQQIENQLTALKAQINPHFLFNSLNVLYALAIDNKTEITNAILQLSDILRYVIYNEKSDTISLNKEINLIENYINFEKNRHIENAKISFHHQVDKSLEIYPMLLLPLLENSFKHGLKSGVKNPYIDVHLTTKNKKLEFKIINNFKEITNDVFKESKGIGLQNIKENLSIIYPEKHHFIIENKENIFTTHLTIYL
ncbi:sensor histidine kinase [Polaribacter sargassicola]|uniref:sensor histidine kinase n=1 Tax=Polaribacter sargassicola TaxID=2836891 RepID=UPI001F01D305|nr:sensor histidine kinase [Polaribacter sp. DS7-9]MCG1035111.1 histidine kinase [Polaribacter sp. DS7-9]